MLTDVIGVMLTLTLLFLSIALLLVGAAMVAMTVSDYRASRARQRGDRD